MDQDDLGWAWLARDRRQIQGCVTFVRGVTAERVLEGFGMDPATAGLMPVERARELFLGTERPWVRVGRSGEWAFAMEEISLIGAVEGAADRLSAGTEAAVLFWTAKPTSGVRYLADGELVTVFEPELAWDRAGSDPDRFLPEMSLAGLDTEGPPQGLSREERLERRRRFDPMIASARMLTLALGIGVSADLAGAPLLTAQRRADDG